MILDEPTDGRDVLDRDRDTWSRGPGGLWLILNSDGTQVLDPVEHGYEPLTWDALNETYGPLQPAPRTATT